jgi:hypothetical protein
MTHIERKDSPGPNGNNLSGSSVSVSGFGRVCFLLLMITMVCSAQQRSSEVTPVNRQELSKAEVTADSKKKEDLFRTSTKVVKTVSANSHSGAETAASADLSASSRSAEVSKSDAPASTGEDAEKVWEEFNNRVTDPHLTEDEGDEKFKLKPEVFIQGRYSSWPLQNDGSESASRFSLTQLEVGWSGSLARRFGVGLELQLHSVINGEPRDVINDAFVEYYLNNNFSLRAGQFTKPFGFDVQQSSALRESPERGMFAGYFFPGEQDRGVMLSGNLNPLSSRALEGVTYSFAVFRGNLFFSDEKHQLNYVARARKVFAGGRFAMGVSMQLGKQHLPEGLSGKGKKTILGADFQYLHGRIGLRGEFVAGHTPSSLFTAEAVPGFRANAHSAGGALTAVYRLSGTDNVYARYDQFNGDPGVGSSVRALNLGYFRRVGKFSKLSFDYQLKNRRSFNDDAVNGRFQTTWSTFF